MNDNQPAETTWLRPLRQNRLSEEIVNMIEDAIKAGHLKPGDRMPSERELAEKLAVSRTGVREAMRFLDSMGLVQVDRGSKGSRLSSRAGDTLTRYIRMSLALDHFSLESILSFRLLVESWAAKRVAILRPAPILEELSVLIEGMRAEDIDRNTWRNLHWEFHATLARGCDNELALAILKACQEVIASEMESAFLRTNLPELQREHAAIFEAIAAGDPELAARLVEEHISAHHELPRPR